MWSQAHVLLVDGVLAGCGKGSTELSSGKLRFSDAGVWLQSTMMNGVLLFFPPLLVSIKSSPSVFTSEAVMSLTRMIG